MQLLIIDDHEGIRELIAATAQPIACDIRQFSSADEVIEHAECFQPDCATIDLRLPGTDGLVALRRLRELYPAVHLIMLTQFDQPSIRERALRAGADELISKTELTSLTLSLAELAKRRADSKIVASDPLQLDDDAEVSKVAASSPIAAAEAPRSSAGTKSSEAEEIEIMIATLSHDLRAPLRAIDAYMRLLGYELGSSSNDKAAAYIERTCRSVELAQDLLEELLDFLRCRHASLRNEELDLSRMAQTIIDELRVIDPRRVVSIQIEAAMRARGDPRLIHRLLYNLLGNAWKFTEHVSDARIAFSTSRSASGTTFCIQDNGCGFAPHESRQLFEPFRRGALQQRYQGYGVGLAIAKRIVDAHGGSIVAESEPQCGARFCFTLAPRNE